MTHRPHVSPALVHLRAMVALCAIAVAACSGLQLLVFGFLHYTQWTWTTAMVETPEPELKVVSTVTPPTPPKFHSLTGQDPGDAATSKAEYTQRMLDGVPGAPTRTPSTFGVLLARANALALSVGIVAAFGLALTTFKGVTIGAGAAVPGIEKAVSASSWSLVIALLTVPWRDVLPSMPFPGVFAGLDTMVRASDALSAGQASGVAVNATYVLLPVVAGVIALVALFKFNAGVQRGIVHTSVSELNEALDREMASIRQSGVGSNYGGRMVGVLNRAMGDPALDTLPRAAEPRPRADDLRPTGTDGELSFKRPI